MKQPEPTVKISDWNYQTLGFAMRELSQAFTHRRDGTQDEYTMRDVKGCLRYINEVVADVYPTPKLDENEAELARCLHTYMRKCMDTPLSCILYRCISENRGLPIWYAFVKELNKNLKDKRDGFRWACEEAERLYREGNDTTDDMMMNAALEMWMVDGGQEDVNEIVEHWLSKDKDATDTKKTVDTSGTAS